MFFDDFRVPEGTPAGENMGKRDHLALRGCPYSRVHSTNPKDLGPEDPYPKGSFRKEGKEDPYPKGSLRKEGKREDGRLDFSLRLVAPGGPADIYTCVCVCVCLCVCVSVCVCVCVYVCVISLCVMGL